MRSAEIKNLRVHRILAVLSGFLIIIALGVWILIFTRTHVEVLYELNQGSLYYQTHWGDFASFFLTLAVTVPVGTVSGVLVFKRCHLKLAVAGICVLLLPLAFIPSELYPLKEIPINPYSTFLPLFLLSLVLVLVAKKEFKKRKLDARSKRALAFSGVFVLLFTSTAFATILWKKPFASNLTEVWVSAHQNTDSTWIEVVNWDTALDGLFIKYEYDNKEESILTNTIPAGGGFNIPISQRLENNSWISLDLSYSPSLEKLYNGKIRVNGELARMGRKPLYYEGEYWMRAVTADNHTEIKLGFFEFDSYWKRATFYFKYGENWVSIGYENWENKNGILTATLPEKLEENAQLYVDIEPIMAYFNSLTVNGPAARGYTSWPWCGTGAYIAWEQRTMDAILLSIVLSMMLTIFVLLNSIYLELEEVPNLGRTQ